MHKHHIIKRWLVALLAMPALIATGQPTSDSIPVKQNELSVDLQFLSRGESRYGGLPAVNVEEENEDEVASSNFVLGRTRLAINYKRDWLQARVTPQHSGVWGQAGKGAFNLFEGWVKMTSRNGLFAQIGRIALDYDDERIIGSDDWAMASSSHDVLRLGYEGHGHKVHTILAYNQNAEVINSGGSLYQNGAQPYKTMQDIWYHYDFSKINLGASLLFMNIGMQSELQENPDKTWFQHLLGAYVKFSPKSWTIDGSYYHQYGKNEMGRRIDAWMASGKVTYKPSNKFSIFTGYDCLSGDKYFAVPDEGSIGLVNHDVYRGFTTVYGSHHQFYGAMDFFYVSTYFDGFSPGLQNAYIGGTYSPLEKLRINASYHYFATAIKLTDKGYTLGNEVELQASYAFTRDINLSVGGSYMQGRPTMKALKRSTKDSLRWGWITLVVNPRIFTTKW